jgi:hypothetical protein
MVVSLCETLDLLNKWMSESTLLDCRLLSTGVGFIGSRLFISALQENVLILSEPDEPEKQSLVVRLELVSAFGYGDPRDAPEEMRSYLSEKVVSVLLMSLPESVLSLFETPRVLEVE